MHMTDTISITVGARASVETSDWGVGGAPRVWVRHCTWAAHSGLSGSRRPLAASHSFHPYQEEPSQMGEQTVILQVTWMSCKPCVSGFLPRSVAKIPTAAKRSGP